MYAALGASESVEPALRSDLLSDDFLDALASGKPTPGGGSAAAYSAAAGASLVAMVARLTIGRKKYLNVEAEMQSALVRAEDLREDLTTAVSRDATAFDAVMAAYRLPKTTSEEIAQRSRAIEEATLEATRIPLDVAEKSLEVMKTAAMVTAKGNINAITDVGTGAALAYAGIKGAGLNVRVNVADLKDKTAADELFEKLIRIEEMAVGIENEVLSVISERGNLNI